MKAGGRSDIGRQRTTNEDSFLIDSERGIFLLADGIGGHEGGEVASRIAVKEAHAAIAAGLPGCGDAQVLLLLNRAAQLAHEAIRNQAHAGLGPEKMGATLVEVVVRDNKAFLSHVGDSRVYLLRDRLRQFTKDHTIGDYLVENRISSREEVQPRFWHALTRAVGIREYPGSDWGVIDLQADDVLLMCSDGLPDMLTDEEIEAVLVAHRTDIELAMDVLVEEANKKGGRDNITLICVAF